jgi:penicillin-binding protein 1A
MEVTDRDGTILEQYRPVPHQVTRADTAYIVTHMLEGAVRQGTGIKAASLGWTLGGKTGTTDEYSDAWFVGFDPEITIGVWIGYDQVQTIGESQTGSEAALPVWIEIMRNWVDRRQTEVDAPPEFARPGNIVFVPTEHGLEVFIAGTEPGGQVAPTGRPRRPPRP